MPISWRIGPFTTTMFAEELVVVPARGVERWLSQRLSHVLGRGAGAAGIATLDIYRDEGLLTRAAELQDDWHAALHSLKGLPHVIDIRTIGLIAGISIGTCCR